MKRYFEFRYKDGCFAEVIAFANIADKEIERIIEKQIKEDFNTNVNHQWHIDRSCVREITEAEFCRLYYNGTLISEECMEL